MPCFLIKKEKTSDIDDPKNYRMVVDGRKFNTKTRKQCPSLDTCEQIIQCIPKGSIKTLLDLKDGFFQLELDKASRKHCALITQDGRFEFERAPQGAQQSPGAFHSRIKEKFEELENVKVYVDEILIIHDSKQEVIKDIKKVLMILTENNLAVNWDKAQIAVDELDVLGV